jgi:hypothetical protein
MRILRGVGSRTLPCGCLVGFYETYDIKTIAVVDARATGCSDPSHRVNATIAVDLAASSRASDESIGFSHSQ